jgi:uncharacterized membrane protein YhaH (DUF805 family)
LTIPGADLAPSPSPPQQAPRDESRNTPETSGLKPREKPEADPEWLSQRLGVVEALHSKDEVEKAWALDLLDRCARKGVEEAKQMLAQHLRASAEERPGARPDVCTEGSASSREETPFQEEGNKTNQLESIYSGRYNRARYFWALLLAFVPLAIIAYILGYVDAEYHPAWSQGAQIFFSFISFAALSPMAVKRLHDLDKPGVYYWLFLVPLAGPVLGLYLLFQRGTRGANRFGADPLREVAGPGIVIKS